MAEPQHRVKKTTRYEHEILIGGKGVISLLRKSGVEVPDGARVTFNVTERLAEAFEEVDLDDDPSTRGTVDGRSVVIVRWSVSEES